MANIRTPNQKEKILKEYLNGKEIKKIEKEYNINNSVVYRRLEKYEKDGINGLKSNTGKSKGGTKGLGKKKPQNRIEELELELMKKNLF